MNKERVNLALKLSKYVHNVCKDVPHDIGLHLEKIVAAHQELRGEGESELQKVMDELAEWSDKTFGGQRNPAMLYHLRKEVDEAIEETKNYQNNIVKNMDIQPSGYSGMKLYLEYADMFMLLLDSARVHGFNAKKIIVAIREKLKINKKRKWGKPDKNGVVEHVPAPPNR